MSRPKLTELMDNILSAGNDEAVADARFHMVMHVDSLIAEARQTPARESIHGLIAEAWERGYKMGLGHGSDSHYMRGNDADTLMKEYDNLGLTQ